MEVAVNEVEIGRDRSVPVDPAATFTVRPSWSAALAGTATMLAVAALLWGLAVAIVALSSAPAGSWRDSVMALWICAMVVTLLGALGGGYVAGYLSPGARPAAGMMHGFLAWAVALLAAFLVQFSVAKTLWTTAALATPDTEGVTLETPGATLNAGPNDEPLSYPPHSRDHLIALSWSWFGTWFLSAVAAVAAGGAGARSLRGRRPSALTPETQSAGLPPPGSFPVAPAHTAGQID